MDVYVYQAGLHCADCAQHIRSTLHAELVALADKEPNSDMAPQGPHSSGGGEADSPQHCDSCGVFLQNPLTDDGAAYVREKVENGEGLRDVLCEWAEFYGIAMTSR